MQETFDVVYALVSLALMVAFLWQIWRSRAAARRTPPLRGRVVSVEREESRSRTYPWFVVTTYAVVGHGLLIHRRGCADEGKAILWQRLHPVDSVHDVIPDAHHKGFAYVPEDLTRREEWYWVPIVAVFVVITVFAIYQFWTGYD